MTRSATVATPGSGMARLVSLVVALGLGLTSNTTAWAQGAPLIRDLGGPLDLGEATNGAEFIDISDAFLGGLRMYTAEGVTEVIPNMTAVLSFEWFSCCYIGQPLPRERISDRRLGRIHLLEMFVSEMGLEPADPDWPIYYAIRPHMPPESPGQLIATWYRVADRPPHVADRRFNSQQLVLTAVGEQGDFDVEMRYARCDWSSPNGRPNAVKPIMGFDADEGPDGPAWMWPGSLSDDTRLLCELSNVREPGVFRFQVRGGDVRGCGIDPPPAEPDGTCNDGNHLPGDGCSPGCLVEPDVDGDGRYEAPHPDALDPLGAYDDCVDPEDPACDDDEDDDGFSSLNDNCIDVFNPDQNDYDGDTLGDACDIDADDDGLVFPEQEGPNAFLDLCPYLFDNGNRRVDPDLFIFAQPLDTDGDGQGDACDADDDNDGISDAGLDGLMSAEDNGYDEDRDLKTDEAGECQPGTDRFQFCDNGGFDLVDNDADGQIDEVAERALPRVVYPGPDAGEDNCRRIPNPGQADLDEDGIGDACDPDVDGDSVPNCAGLGICGPDADYRDNDRDGFIDEATECLAPECDPFTDLIDQDQDDHADEILEVDGAVPAPAPVDNCPTVPNRDQADRNDDGVGDACADDDGDGHLGFADNCIATPNEDQLDTDGDGAGDACDLDDDDDLRPDADDNCRLVPNPDQTDSDGDLIGDACDPDDDDDGVNDVIDNCPLLANEGQVDTDGDALGDACDGDDDDDGRLDPDDNCPLAPNPEQLDTDGDTEGDACDGDDDNDGIADAIDVCPLVADRGQQDLDGDGEGDACDVDDDDDGTPDLRDVCPALADDQTDTDSDGAGDACDADDDDDGWPDEADLCPLHAAPAGEFEGGTQPDIDGDGRGDACDQRDDRPFDVRSPQERCAILLEQGATTSERLAHCPTPVHSVSSCDAAPGPGPGGWGWLALAALGCAARRRQP